MHVPPLETERLIIRPFSMNDLDAVYQLLDVDLSTADFGSEGVMTREERQQWLQWTVLSYEGLDRLNQPRYGDRAVVLKQAWHGIGAGGCVPCFVLFGQVLAFRSANDDAAAPLVSPEVGLFY